MNHGELGGRLLACGNFPRSFPPVSQRIALPSWLAIRPQDGCLTLAEAIAERTAAAVGCHFLYSGSGNRFEYLGLHPGHHVTYVLRTENFAFVNAMCQMRS